MSAHSITNALTVDVEDYFHVSAFADRVAPSAWDDMEYRVENNTRRLLTLFSEHDVRATFFVLGWVARRSPELLREIHRGGHEVACHGLNHELVYEQSPEQFERETRDAKRFLEDTLGSPVFGYRAASWSITPASRWALDVIAELGFEYDSSVFPIRHDRYGMPDANPAPHVLTTPAGRRIVEFPPSTVSVFGFRLPVAGGGYFRLFPYSLTRAGLRRLNGRAQPFMFYLHPWEIDPAQPRLEGKWLSRFRHYTNLAETEARLRRLLAEFRCSTMHEVLHGLGLLASSESREPEAAHAG